MQPTAEVILVMRFTCTEIQWTFPGIPHFSFFSLHWQYYTEAEEQQIKGKIHTKKKIKHRRGGPTIYSVWRVV